MLPQPTIMPSSSTPKPLLHVPYTYVMIVTFSLPVLTLFSVVSLGVYLHPEKVTSTHCRVPNIVPSISAVVGGVTPERYIWRLGMAFFSFPRVFDAFLYFNFFSHSQLITQLWYSWLNRAVLLVHVLQYLGLFGLSYISSTENFLIHRNCFILFIVCSMLHMVLFLILFKAGRTPPTYRDRISFRLRVAFMVSHFVVFLVSLYFYWRHNTYCEPYMYSVYCTCEYLVVLTNVAFHTIEAIDFQNDYYISVAPPSRLKHN